MTKSRHATVGSHTALVVDDSVFQFTGGGSDGTAYQSAVSIQGFVDGTVSSGVVPGRLSFHVANASGAMTERARLHKDGDFRIGTGSALATTATDGFLLITCSAGAPTGVPTNAGAGQIPLHFDKTNFQLYAYISGTGWKKSTVWT